MKDTFNLAGRRATRDVDMLTAHFDRHPDWFEVTNVIVASI
jgi:hypothetical protein